MQLEGVRKRGSNCSSRPKIFACKLQERVEHGWGWGLWIMNMKKGADDDFSHRYEDGRTKKREKEMSGWHQIVIKCYWDIWADESHIQLAFLFFYRTVTGGCNETATGLQIVTRCIADRAEDVNHKPRNCLRNLLPRESVELVIHIKFHDDHVKVVDTIQVKY